MFLFFFWGLLCCTCYYALLFLKFRLVFLASHLAILMPCTLLLSCFAPCCSRASLHFVVAPNSYHITLYYFRAFVHLFVMPCSSCVALYCFCSCALLLSFSRLAIRTTLLFMPYCPTITPCCFTLLFVRPCCPAIMPCYSPFSSTSYPLTPLLFCCLVAHNHTLLLCLVYWYSIFTFLCRWRSLEQHQQASSNNKGFYFSTFFEFCFVCFVFCEF